MLDNTRQPPMVPVEPPGNAGAGAAAMNSPQMIFLRIAGRNHAIGISSRSRLGYDAT
jgi:hypothetical protein